MLLQDVSAISESIDDLAKSYVKREGSRLASTTEFDRVREAIWRFQLCYEICHPEGHVTLTERDPSLQAQVDRYVPCSTEGFCSSPLTTGDSPEEKRASDLDGKYKTYFQLHTYLQQTSVLDLNGIRVIRKYIVSSISKLQVHDDRTGGIRQINTKSTLLKRYLYDLKR